MRKPIIDLNAVVRVDAAPLKKALEVSRKATDELAAAKVRLIALQKEIADFLENTDPDDTDQIRIVSGKQTQASILPNLIRKLERKIDDEIVPTLLREADKFRSDLKQFYRAAHSAAEEQLAALFRPFFAVQVDARSGERTDRALEIARQTDDCRVIGYRLEQAEQVRFPSHSRSVENALSYDRSACDAAETLLALAETS